MSSNELCPARFADLTRSNGIRRATFHRVKQRLYALAALSEGPACGGGLGTSKTTAKRVFGKNRAIDTCRQHGVEFYYGLSSFTERTFLLSTCEVPHSTLLEAVYMRFPRIGVFAALVGLSLGFASESSGDIVFEMDLDRNAADLQQVLTVTAGQRIEASVVLRVNDAGLQTSLSGYSFSIAIDKAVFDFADQGDALNRPFNLAPEFGIPFEDWVNLQTPVLRDNTGMDTGADVVPYADFLGINGFAAGVLTEPTMTTNFTSQVAWVTLVAKTSGEVTTTIGDNVGDILIGSFVSSDDGLDAMGTTIAPAMIRYNNRAVAVPEPSAFAFAGLCAIGIVYRQRRKAKTNAAK